MQSLTVGSVVAETYQVTGLLGRGGMGSVWEANHLRLPGKRVAIKVLNADAAADQEALARFRREAEIATRLGHPNIIEVHDFNLLPGGQPYLVLELLVGESLDARMRRGPIPAEQVMRIAGQIAGALAAAHRAGVVHRDLKPQNVYLVPREDEVGGELVKVLDFGISKIRGSQTVKTNDSTILGTPQYMAPEQATGNHAAVDERTDVFALGAIIYEMLAGRPAFTGENIPEVVYKVVYETPAPLAPQAALGVTPRMIQAVERALAKKQAERFPDVAVFIEHLSGMSISTLRRQPILRPEGEPVPADPLAATVDSGRRERASLPPPPVTSTADETLKTRRGWRRALGLCIALAALAVGGAVVAVVMTGGGDRTETAAAPPPTAAPAARTETAEDVRKLAAQAIGEEILQMQEEGGDGLPEDVFEGETDEEDADEGEDGDMPAPAPPAKAATPDKRRSSLPVHGMRPADETTGDEGPTSAGGDEVRSDLAAGESALRAGDFREALYRAERASRHGAGPAAFAIIARAHCAMDDVGNAAGALRRIPASRVLMRRMVRAYCAARGVDLDD
ncbi:MAG TPA: serine/threonine-protein kinase [Kofleriaceae bacterium]|nr:serine/threonine-protein kinase [Kofleriaceae bacterium]